MESTITIDINGQQQVLTMVQDAGEDGRYRWLSEDGEDSETSGATEDEAWEAAWTAWSEHIIDLG